ncbi:MAG: anhydro-N-acetylmuramic acid kinase [Planctomycetales bacterium]|nr:anhydro-N-acetylmuramic acid kinase [Planctomycetales bacterium]
MRRFRFFAQRDTDPGHPNDGIERQRRLRHRRELLGLYVDLVGRRIQASRVATVGSGRWSRFEPMWGTVHEIPTKLLEPILENASARRASLGEPSRSDEATSPKAARDAPFELGDALALSADLSDWLAPLIGSWASLGGGQEEDLLAVTLHDSGWLWPDFDGAPRYVNPLDATRLAERCGWPVIADLRSADIAAGGLGTPLDPLPYWFLLADRSERIATSSRVVVRLDRDCELLFLPASDGLDAEHPLIERGALPIWNEVIRTLRSNQPVGGRPVPWGQLAVQGRVSEPVRAWLQQARFAPPAESLMEVAGRAAASTPDLARTAIDWLVERITEFTGKNRPMAPRVDHVLLIAGGPPDGYLQQALRRAAGVEVDVLESLTPWKAAHWDATLTATLGFLHIDQQPASLPWLTQADVPRLHGHIHPGHLASWRRLVVEMADFRPPPMKLREAM